MIEQNYACTSAIKHSGSKNKEENLLKTHIVKGSYTKENTTSEFNKIVFSHADVIPLCGLQYWITANGLYAFLPCKLVKFSKKLTIKSPEWNFSLGV